MGLPLCLILHCFSCWWSAIRIQPWLLVNVTETNSPDIKSTDIHLSLPIGQQTLFLSASITDKPLLKSETEDFLIRLHTTSQPQKCLFFCLGTAQKIEMMIYMLQASLTHVLLLELLEGLETNQKLISPFV